MKNNFKQQVFIDSKMAERPPSRFRKLFAVPLLLDDNSRIFRREFGYCRVNVSSVGNAIFSKKLHADWLTFVKVSTTLYYPISTEKRTNGRSTLQARANAICLIYKLQTSPLSARICKYLCKFMFKYIHSCKCTFFFTLCASLRHFVILTKKQKKKKKERKRERNTRESTMLQPLSE